MVKTRRFGKRIYLGDPVNVINLFNRFEVDEIVLLDIGATARGNGPDVALIQNLADECWVPLTYGGGIRSTADVEQLIRAGVEKVVIGHAAAHHLLVITDAARAFGTQCIVGSLDVRRNFFGGLESRTCNAKHNLKTRPVERARALEQAGAGEILLQSVDRDGEMTGYDLETIASISAAVDIPVVACSGAARREDLATPILQAGASAAAAGSLFVFSGPERGVLINFPERHYLEALLGNAVEPTH